VNVTDADISITDEHGRTICSAIFGGFNSYHMV